MKKHSFCFLSLFVLLLACGSDSNDKTTVADRQATAATSESAEAGKQQTSNTLQGDGIVGYWKLHLEAYDNNGNRKLDDEERKKGIQNRYSFRFNADGTCGIMDMFKGRYEIKTTNGKKMLSVYRKRVVGEEEKDPLPDVFEITSMTNDELVLLENLGNLTFWAFKRS